MKQRVYTITEAKAQLSDILRRVKRGERIAIGAARTPEVELRIYKPLEKQREFGKLRGKFVIDDDFTKASPEIEKLFSGE